jgi:glycerophosphoryl diester phosphodiesterase
MEKTYLLLISLLLLVFSSCKKQETTDVKTKFLGHRGAGISHNASTKPIENTLESVEFGLNIFNGFELDIQMSKDSIIYVFHDAEIITPNLKSCLPNLESSIIDTISLFRNKYKYNIDRLEEIFQLIAEQDSTYFISLDVKGYFENGCFETRNASHHYFDVMAEKLANLINKYEFTNTVFVETDYATFLLEIKNRNKDIKCFVLGYSNFEQVMKKAMKNDFDGISFNIADTLINEETIFNAHKKGLLVQFWTPNSEEDLVRAISLNPDFIQTDNENYKSFIIE